MDTNISLPSRKQAATINKQSEIDENYQVLCQQLKALSIKVHESSREQGTPSNEENETGENYQVSCKELKTSTVDGLSGADCSIEELLNEVNISLISESCPVEEQPTKDEHIESKLQEQLVWDRLKSFLSRKPVVKANENSGFSFFPVKINVEVNSLNIQKITEIKVM